MVSELGWFQFLIVLVLSRGTTLFANLFSNATDQALVLLNIIEGQLSFKLGYLKLHYSIGFNSSNSLRCLYPSFVYYF